MSDVRGIVQGLMKEARQEAARRRELDEIATALRFAWKLGVDKLYKFRSLDGDSKDWTLDIIQNSRLFFARPDQFNDPFDCAPPFALAKDPTDPAFVKELEDDERRMAAESGLTAKQLEQMRVREGVPVEKMAAAVRENTLRQLRDDTRVFCLSAEQCHPLLWSHYADSHKGVCLHFSCGYGTLIGLARQVACKEDREPILIPLQYQTDDQLTDKMVLVKAAFWAYESEFRIIGHTRADWGHSFDEKGRVSFPPELFCGITLGTRISEDNRAEIVALAAARMPAIPIWQAIEDEGRFWMRVERVA
jgi:hypothetical protein